MIEILYSTARSRRLTNLDKPKAGAWISVVGPSKGELDTLASAYDLDRDLLTDAVDIFEAPRIESDNGKVYIFTRYCHPSGQEIATEPLLVVHTADHVITVVRGSTSILDRLRDDELDFVTTQKTKLLLRVLGEINRSYRLQLTVVSKQILRFRAMMRAAEISNRDFVSFIEIEEDLNEFLSALQPQSSMLASLLNGRFIKLYEDDKDLVEDMTLGADELIDLTKSRLKTLVNIRQAYDAIATNNLNKTFKRLTSIAIFLTIPTIVGGLWGMNVALPFDESPHAFLIVLSIICGLGLFSVWLFRRNKWL
jgi:magnesium transporter